MKEIIIDQGWQLLEFMPQKKCSWEEMEDAFSHPAAHGRKVYELKQFPAQVHDVLLSHGVIRNPNIRGKNEDLWIEETDWAYRSTFRAQEGAGARLVLEGVDTFADVWLNGVFLGSCRDVFMNHTFDISEQVRENNILLIYFHSSKRIMDEFRISEEYKGLVPAISAARVFRSGFHDYCGPVPRLIRCGLYGKVTCRQTEKPAFLKTTADVKLMHKAGTGRVEVSVVFEGEYEGENWRVVLRDQKDKVICKKIRPVRGRVDKMVLEISKPKLWYPWTCGEPVLYSLEISCGGADGDKVTRKIGFRSIVQKGDLDFRINGKPIKLWGVNLTHPDTLSNCYRRERMNQLLDLVQLANCNIVRVWGESEKYPEEFYEECDRRGLLVWQDFYLCCSMYPEDEDYMRLCGLEAAEMVERLKAHPCILLWCGGNEIFLARDYSYPDTYCFGEKIVKEVYPKVCARLDPERYYHISSPSGGGWANDPAEGDTHGYTHLWFVPGRKFPVFLSENCRVSTPALKTMEQMMEPEELWPAGYHAGVTRRNRLEWPESWQAHTTNECWKKLGPVEQFPDAENAEELIYNIGAAHALYIHDQVCRFRRGYASDAAEKVRKTKGHMLWKFNNNSNIISYGIVDYFLEPYYPYYELKHCYSPFLVSCELGDHGSVWVTNDTAESVTGKMKVFLFHLGQNRVTGSFETAFQVSPDESYPVCSLDIFGQFRKENIICAAAYDAGGNLLGMSMDACESERRLEYPSDTGLEIVQQGKELLLTVRAYARCIELSGDEDGDRFGWLFSDNYFDLIPGMVKRVSVLGNHKKGTVTAKAAYDARRVTCSIAWT